MVNAWSVSSCNLEGAGRNCQAKVIPGTGSRESCSAEHRCNGDWHLVLSPVVNDERFVTRDISNETSFAARRSEATPGKRVGHDFTTGSLGRDFSGRPWKMSFLEEEKRRNESPQFCVADVRQVRNRWEIPTTRPVTGDKPRPNTNGGSQEGPSGLREPAIVGGCSQFA